MKENVEMDLGKSEYRLRVGIDYRLAQQNIRGMGRYVASIVEVLKKQDYGLDFFLLCTHSPVPNFNAEYMKVVIGGSDDFILYEQFSLPRICSKLNLDALWCPANTFPLFLSSRTKLVVTIHDLIFLMRDIPDPKGFRQFLGKKYRSIVCKLGVNRINVLLTDSMFSKRDINKRLGRSDAVYAPIRIDPQPADEKDSLNVLPLGLTTKGYFFTVSGDAPSKNLNNLIFAYKKSHTALPLVIAGVSSLTSIEKFKKNAGPNVLFTGYVSEKDLWSLYKHAACFIFPSLAEGFGIPILEAMRNELPIIASNRTSIPEVLGSAGRLFDPLDVDELASLIEDFTPSAYEGLITAQKHQLDKYSDWSKTASIVVDAIKGAFA